MIGTAVSCSGRPAAFRSSRPWSCSPRHALVLGYKLLAPRGYELEVSFLGKLATWVLYGALCLVIVTEKGTSGPSSSSGSASCSRSRPTSSASPGAEERPRQEPGAGREIGQERTRFEVSS